MITVIKAVGGTIVNPPAPQTSAVGILYGSVSTTAVCVEALRRSITGYRQ